MYGDIEEVCTPVQKMFATNHYMAALHQDTKMQGAPPTPPGSLGPWCWRREDGEVEAQPVPPSGKGREEDMLALALPQPRALPPEQTAAGKCTPTSQEEVK